MKEEVFFTSIGDVRCRTSVSLLAAARSLESNWRFCSA